MAWGKNLRCHIKGVMESRKEDFWRSSFEIEKCLVGGCMGECVCPLRHISGHLVQHGGAGAAQGM